VLGRAGAATRKYPLGIGDEAFADHISKG